MSDITTLQDVADVVELEGFDYAFYGYSEFEEVDDKEFHRLRENYLAARQALADYVGCD